MPDLFQKLLAGEDRGPSVLDVDPALLEAPVTAPQRPGAGAQRLTEFDLADEGSEQRAYARRRAVHAAALAAGSVAAIAGSLALGLS